MMILRLGWNCMKILCIVGIQEKNSTKFFFQIVRTYFPFQPFSSGNSKKWGVCQFLPLDNLSITDFDLHSKYKNFHEFPLRISFFERYPTSMKLTDLSKASQTSYLMKDIWRANNFSGLDGLMLSTVVKSFNFTPILVKPKGADFGYRTPDGKFIGAFF